MDDGGPAFPAHVTVGPDDTLYTSGDVEAGMSLRDWFAGQALAGLVTRGPYVDGKAVSARAYEVADAMLEARK